MEDIDYEGIRAIDGTYIAGHALTCPSCTKEIIVEGYEDDD